MVCTCNSGLWFDRFIIVGLNYEVISLLNVLVMITSINGKACVLYYNTAAESIFSFSVSSLLNEEIIL